MKARGKGNKITNGIADEIPTSHFLINDLSTVCFQEQFDEKTVFGVITDEQLLFSMFSVYSRIEVPSKLFIGIQAGFQSKASNKGFSVRHILGRGHVRAIADLINIINNVLTNVNNITASSSDLALAWSEENCAYVLAAAMKTKQKNPALQHTMLTLYLSGNEKLIIGTSYYISRKEFLDIKLGRNSRYRLILDKTITSSASKMAVLNPQENYDNNSSYSNMWTVLSRQKDYFDESISYSELVESGILQENNQLMTKSLHVQCNKTIHFLNTQMGLYKKVTEDQYTHTKFIIETKQKIIPLCNSIIEIITRLKSDAVAEIKVDEILIAGNIFENFLLVEEEIASYSKKIISTLDIIDAQGKELENYFIFSKLIKLYEKIEDSDLFEKINIVNRINQSSVTRDHLDYFVNYSRQATLGLEKIRPFIDEKLFDQLLGAICNYSLSTFDKKLSIENFFVELKETKANIHKMYMLTLNCANLLIKHALKNDLNEASEYEAINLFIARLFGIKSELKKISCKTGNDAQFNFFETKLNAYQIKYKFNFYTEGPKHNRRLHRKQ